MTMLEHFGVTREYMKGWEYMHNHWRCPLEEGVLKNLANLIDKHLC